MRIRGPQLEANLATDKKSSHLNILRTLLEVSYGRGACIPRVPGPRGHAHHARRDVPGPPGQQPGGLMACANNNGNHSANGIAALFAATGQGHHQRGRVISGPGAYRAPVTESLLLHHHPGADRRHLRRRDRPTQRECLELLGCYGAGKVRKLAEIVAATAVRRGLTGRGRHRRPMGPGTSGSAAASADAEPWERAPLLTGALALTEPCPCTRPRWGPGAFPTSLSVCRRLT